MIRDDLDDMDERSRRFARYFSIAHLANAGLSEDQLQTYRHGLAKLVNSLSWQSDIVAPKAIDPGRTVFRIDLRDYRWNAAVWQRILDAYPYGIVQQSVAGRAVFVATGCELAASGPIGSWPQPRDRRSIMRYCNSPIPTRPWRRN